ncbi:hypothetical protein BDZ89DRAFT_1064721 [Hymenopellis radicata]|nr:hypothetical protein BDZ89DRAFT_1064721 [Hymenopellis radicata]
MQCNLFILVVSSLCILQAAIAAPIPGATVNEDVAVREPEPTPGCAGFGMHSCYKS